MFANESNTTHARGRGVLHTHGQNYKENEYLVKEMQKNSGAHRMGRSKLDHRKALSINGKARRTQRRSSPQQLVKHLPSVFSCEITVKRRNGRKNSCAEG